MGGREGKRKRKRKEGGGVSRVHLVYRVSHSVRIRKKELHVHVGRTTVEKKKNLKRL